MTLSSLRAVSIFVPLKPLGNTPERMLLSREDNIHSHPAMTYDGTMAYVNDTMAYVMAQ